MVFVFIMIFGLVGDIDDFVVVIFFYFWDCGMIDICNCYQIDLEYICLVGFLGFIGIVD